MKYKAPRMMIIFFMTSFNRDRGHAPLDPQLLLCMHSLSSLLESMTVTNRSSWYSYVNKREMAKSLQSKIKAINRHLAVKSLAGVAL